MDEVATIWQHVLDYRRAASAWRSRGFGLADTRLRVARLLDTGFGYGLDEVEAEFTVNGATADYLLRLGDTPWAAVVVQPMATGLSSTPPAEAFVIADGAGVSWCWVTDGLGVHLYHVGAELRIHRIVACHLLDDDEQDLRAAWRLLVRPHVAAGDLERYRQERERPDVDAVAIALRHARVLDVLRDVLADDYADPGTLQQLAGQVERLLSPPRPRPESPEPQDAETADDHDDEPTEGPFVDLTPTASSEDTDGVPVARAGSPTVPAEAPGAARTAAARPEARPTGENARPKATQAGMAASLAALLPRRRRRVGWQVQSAEAMAVPVPDLQAVAATADGEPDATSADGRPGAADAGDEEVPPAEDGPTAAARPVARPAAAVADPRPGQPSPGQAPTRRPSPAGQNVMSALMRQRQTHERLRQNLRDLREHRAQLQDALSELRQDYPERFENMVARLRQVQSRRDETGAPAAGASRGQLHSFGNGCWEWQFPAERTGAKAN